MVLGTVVVILHSALVIEKVLLVTLSESEKYNYMKTKDIRFVIFYALWRVSLLVLSKLVF